MILEAIALLSDPAVKRVYLLIDAETARVIGVTIDRFQAKRSGYIVVCCTAI